ncbi:MAG: glycoside hydrolase family 43 protein [Oscillospiraceae bacterium]|nr:glycoside hydrolase family 43 protein [Oscillospiraceae bacterium]
MGAYLFVHFIGTESDPAHEQIYFSVSKDGTIWKTLNRKQPILTSMIGEAGVRDPYIERGKDGKFYVIATDLSIYHRRYDKNRWLSCQQTGSRSLIVWESPDLIHWTAPEMIECMDESAGCLWAPEAEYDPAKDAYMVFWASKTSDDNFTKQRMYRAYTKDFHSFTKPEIFIENENCSIDTTITSHSGIFYRFTKDETFKAVTMESAPSLDGPWEPVETYTIDGIPGNTVFGYEGPTIFKYHNENKWCLLLDHYSGKDGYKPFITTDIAKGKFTSAGDAVFDDIYRHGTTMPITDEEYDALVNAYPID